VNTLQLLWLGTDNLKSNNKYSKNYFDENKKLHIFVSMRKLIFLIVILSSCATQKFYSENGRQISKKTYNRMKERRFKYVMEHMNDVDKSIIKTLKITETVKDSLIKSFNDFKSQRNLIIDFYGIK
jgi:hypothetical protein